MFYLVKCVVYYRALCETKQMSWNMTYSFLTFDPSHHFQPTKACFAIICFTSGEREQNTLRPTEQNENLSCFPVFTFGLLSWVTRKNWVLKVALSTKQYDPQYECWYWKQILSDWRFFRTIMSFTQFLDMNLLNCKWTLCNRLAVIRNHLIKSSILHTF